MIDDNANGPTRQRVTIAVLDTKMDNVIASVAELKTALRERREADEKWRAAHFIEISTMKSEIAVLKIKAGAWGMAGGAIPLVIMILIDLLRGP